MAETGDHGPLNLSPVVDVEAATSMTSENYHSPVVKGSASLRTLNSIVHVPTAAHPRWNHVFLFSGTRAHLSARGAWFSYFF